MASEKHNEAEGWKSRLEDPACMPAEAPLNKEVAWDALYARLRNKPARKRTGWYWAAAACLLMAFCLPWITGHKKNAGLANHPGHSQHTPPPLVPPVPAITKITTTTIHYPETERPLLTETTEQAPQKHNIVNPLHYKKEPSLPHTVALAQTTTTAQVTLTAIPDSPLLTQVAVAPRKQLRVVALNELEPPAEHSNPVRTADKHYWQMKFNNGYAYTGPAQETEPPVPHIIKIKLSPSKN